jgi:hypothetical protein
MLYIYRSQVLVQRGTGTGHISVTHYPDKPVIHFYYNYFTLLLSLTNHYLQFVWLLYLACKLNLSITNIGDRGWASWNRASSITSWPPQRARNIPTTKNLPHKCPGGLVLSPYQIWCLIPCHLCTPLIYCALSPKCLLSQLSDLKRVDVARVKSSSSMIVMRQRQWAMR